MNPEKVNWKVVGLVSGVLLLIGGGLGYYFWKQNQEEDDTYNPYVPQKSTNTATGQAYPKEEVIKMQKWLLFMATANFNYVVSKAINDTGGADGVMGQGFYKALSEAIKENWVTDVKDLHSKAMAWFGIK